MECTTKFERSKTISAISEELLDNPRGSIRFFKRIGSNAQDCKNDEVEQLDRKKSHEKIAHALRDYAAQHRKNQEKHERSMALQQQTMPEQNISLQQPVRIPDDHAHHRLTPQINNLTEQALIVQEQLSLAQYENRSSMTSNHRVSLESQSEFGGFDGYNNQYAAPLNPGQNGLVQGASEDPVPIDGEQIQRGLVSESNHRHLERFEGTVDGSSKRYDQVPRMEEFSEFSESEGYDNFDPAPLVTGSSNRHMEGSSLRHMEGVERTGSTKSVGRNGSYRSDGSYRSFGRNGSSDGSYRSVGRNGSNRSVSAHGSLRHVDLGPSSRSFRSRSSIDEMSLLQTSMGTLSLGNSNMTGMSLEMGESTLTLQTRPEMMSDKSRLDMGESTFTLQSRPEMMSEKSMMEMSFENPISFSETDTR